MLVGRVIEWRMWGLTRKITAGLPGGAIAILGGACRFPGASSISDVADILLAGRDALASDRPSLWVHERYLHPAPRTRGRTYTFAHGLLDNVDQFDIELFGISPREAQQIDPQQLLLLEVAHEALEDAGLSRTALACTKVGVFVGASFCDHFHRRLMDVAMLDGYFMTGAAMSILSNRISHAFDWKGPSLTVDTACSSALVALHLACQALRSGEVDTAVVGAVNLLLAPEPFVGFAQASLLSPTGRCRPFSAAADGYVRSEGAGVVVLRRRDALAPDDAPRAWVLATGSNSDGHTNGISLPNAAAQSALLRQVYADAGVAPVDICYLEAHATGTAVGDPIEARAIGEALGRARVRPLPVGSAKSSFGHLEAASGMVGLFAAMTVLQSRSLPQLAHFAAPNSNIDFAGLCLEPTAVGRPLADDEAAIVGINSFGFGGTNAHAIIASNPAASTPAHRARAAIGMPPLLLSAQSAPALAELAGRWADFLADLPEHELAPVLRGVARGRALYDHRLAVHAATPGALCEALQAWRRGTPEAAAVEGHAGSGALGFVFSGNGAQWAGMGQLAMRENSAFRDAIRALDPLLASRLGWSVLEALNSPDPDRMRRTDVAQPMLFAVQYALVEALAAAGVRPAAVAGHSVGEIAAAWACGGLELEAALDVLVTRSALQQQTHGQGRMAVCGVDAATVRVIFAEHNLTLEVAAVNAPRAVTVAGPAADIAELGAVIRAVGAFFSELDLDYAFHSRLLDPIEPELRRLLATLHGRVPHLPFVSTVTGTAEPKPDLRAGYWWRNIREPVRLDAALDTMDTLGIGTLLEIGPHPVLQSFLREAQRKSGRPVRVLASLTRGQTNGDPVWATIAACHVAGHDIATGPLFDGERRVRGLPHYPFQRQTFALPASREGLDISGIARTHPLLGFPVGDSKLIWRALIDTTLFPWLNDHVVDGDVVVPAMALLDMALAAARARFADSHVLDLLDVELRQPVLLEPGQMIELGLQIGAERNTFEIVSRTRLSDAPWSVHVTGRMAVGERMPVEAGFAPVNGTTTAPDALYRRASTAGFTYGPSFQTVAGLTLHDARSATVTFRAPDADHAARAKAGSILDPAWGDGSLHGLIGLLTGQTDTEPAMMLPRRFAKVRHFGQADAIPRSARLTLVRNGPRAVEAAIQLLDADGECIADFAGVWLVRVPMRRQRESPSLWTTQWRPLPSLNQPMARLRAPLTGPGIPEMAPQDAAILLDACISSAAYAALAPLGVESDLHPDALVGTGDVHPAAKRLLQHMLEWLEADGLATRRGGAWQLAGHCDLPAAPDIWRSLLGDLPQITGELALLASAIEGLPRGLADGPRAAADLSPAMLQQMLEDGPDGAATVAAVAGRVASVAAACLPDRPLRILEVGVRDTLLAAAIARHLSRSAPGLYYVAATASPEAIDVAETALHGLPGRIIAWDQLSDPPPEIMPGGGFDLIVGAYAGSLGPAGRTLPALLAPLLAPEGRIILAEPSPNRLWQLALDADLEQTGAAGQHLLSGASWLALMDGAGLRHAHAEQISGMLWPVSLLEAEATQPDEPAAQPALEPAAQHADVLLAGEPDDPLAEALAQQWTTLGGAVRRCRITELTVAAEQPNRHVIVLAGDPATAPPSLGDLSAAARQLAAASTSLCLVTRGEAAGEPVAAALEAALRVLANETSTLSCRSIRVSRGLLPETAAARVAQEYISGADEPEIFVSANARLAPRLRRLSLPAEQGGAAQLAIRQPGNLDTLQWRPLAPAQPGAGEVTLEVSAAGINFRDLMWSLGVLPDEALLDGFAGATLGMECAGTVLEVGPDVTALRPGDRVMALAPAALATHTTTRAAACLPLPAAMDFAAAATMPVAFMTVCHALGDLARLAEGETVLVHAAAGGVGLAAIQYATHRGAEVIVTAGSEVKRTFLRTLGVRHVFDSRRLRFADEVMTVTGGRGVDVVLNSLHGEAMRRSMALLAPFGRFIELGKRDFIADTAIGVRPLRRNAAYFGVDTDHLAHLRPARAAALFEELSTLMASGALRPLPHRVMGYADVVDAFRVMQSAEHIGKLVLTVDRAAPRIRVNPPRFVAEPSGTYVVTGDSAVLASKPHAGWPGAAPGTWPCWGGAAVKLRVPRKHWPSSAMPAAMPGPTRAMSPTRRH